ncbi:Tyrosine recombinase XerC [termite gut metagenome]|uniref:Tyrosine recombinase XerC n=1 Tax=termite gut metagenome TaxID=433724 RepID=A0A5J4QDX2_9ZZZZ
MKQLSKRSTFAVLFYINKSKQKKNGLCPVMGRITIDTGVAQFSVKADVNPFIWDAKSGRAIGKSKETNRMNRLLDKLEAEIRSHYSRMVLEDAYVTVESVKNALNGIGKKATNLLELFREHNEEFKLRVGINRVFETYEQYCYSYRLLSKFIRLRYHVDDMALCQLNYHFIDAYDFYLRVDKRMTVNTVLNHIIPLRKIIRRAISQDTLKRDPFINYVPEKPLKQRRYLTAEEFQKLLNTTITEPHLIRTRDMFLFASFTGLAYADIKNLSEKHLSIEQDGTQWIKIERQKTKSECNIRLLNIPIQIMEKYRHERTDGRIFKMNSLGNMDVNLKKVAQKCGIESRLTFHMGRHTYATQVCLSQGVPIETLSKMMGHKSIQTTQIYAKITNQKVNEDMKILSNRIENKYEMPKDDVPDCFRRNQYYK